MLIKEVEEDLLEIGADNFAHLDDINVILDILRITNIGEDTLLLEEVKPYGFGCFSEEISNGSNLISEYNMYYNVNSYMK